MEGCLYVRKIYLSQRRWKLKEKPTDTLNQSVVENIAQRFPHKSVTLLNAFEIFNLELFSTIISSTQFRCFGLSVIKILATNYKIDELVLKKEWCSFRFELKEFKTKW